MTGLIVFGVAFLVVLSTAVLRNVEWSTKTVQLIAAVLAAVGGAVTALASNDWSFESFSGSDVLELSLVVYGASQLLYSFILKGTPLISTLESSVVKPKESVETDLAEGDLDVVDSEVTYGDD